MKRVISILLVLVIISTIFAIFAAGFNSGGFSYTTSGTSATLTGWASSSGSVNIPATVSNGGTTYNVTAIGEYAFADKADITSVTFNGSNLKTIGEGAFSTNRRCTSLTIPASVTDIGARAFHSWVSLSSLTFANGSALNSIGKWAFRNAQSLPRLNLPNKQSGNISINEGAFSYCNSLTTVNFPECVNAIGEESFVGCVNLSSVTIRNENASIGSNAFDLTSSRINDDSGKTERTLVVTGYEDSSAQRFANAEHFTFNYLPPKPTSDSIQYPPNAGKYYVYIEWYVTNAAAPDDNAITINYKKQDGTTGTSAITDCAEGEDGHTQTSDLVLDGAPYSVKVNLKTSGWGTVSEWYVKKIICYSDAEHTKDAKILFNGTFGGKNGNITKNMYNTCTLPKTLASTSWNAGSGGTCSNSGYNSVSGTAPTITSIGALTNGVSEASVNTDGTNYRSPIAFTYGQVKDQYGVVMNQNPTLSVVAGANNTNSVEGASIESDYRRLVLTSQANKANDYDIYIRQSAGTKYNTKKVRIHTFDYQVVFSYTEGTQRKALTQTVEYGTIPTAPDVTPQKYDSYGHQAFKKWSDEATVIYTDGPQEVIAEAEYYDIAEHYFNGEVEEQPATCTKAQELKEDCVFCNYSKVSYGTPALGHTGDTVLHSLNPTDGENGVAYYQCTRCNTCWGAINDSGSFTKDTSNVQEAVDGEPNIASVVENTSPTNILAPAPAFNRFHATAFDYDYSTRGASLKIEGSSNIDLSECATTPSSPLLTSVKQGMRFTASMHIPAGVSLTDTGSGNRLTDFGYVWSQTNVINANENIANLEEGKTKVYQTSVVANNSDKEAFTGNNWKGVSAHDDDLGGSGKTLTFNLVINVKARNWKKAYCARAYIKYVYNGVEYTVYDNSFSSRSVGQIAPLIAQSNSETAKVKNYCQNKIVNNLDYLPE